MKSFTIYAVNIFVLLCVCNTVMCASWWAEPISLSDRSTWISLSTGAPVPSTTTPPPVTTSPPATNTTTTPPATNTTTTTNTTAPAPAKNTTSGTGGTVITNTTTITSNTTVGVSTGTPIIPARCIGKTGYTPTCPCTSNCWFKTTVTPGMCSCGSLEDVLAMHEGKRYCVYNDQVGIATIGIGFNMIQRTDSRALITGLGLNFDAVLAGSQCLNDAQISSLFNYDISWSKIESRQCISNFDQHSM